MADIEEGVAYMLAAFERGVMNIAKSQGDKRRASANSSNDDDSSSSNDDRENEPVASTAVHEKTPRAPRKGMTYEEALAPRAKRQRSNHKPTSAPAETSQSARGESDTESVPARAGMTYDEVLKPVHWRTLVIGCLGAIVLCVLYVGATFLQVWSSTSDDETQPVDAIIVLGAAQFDGTPSPVLAARLDHALALYEDRLARFIVTTGSNREGDRFTEGFSGFVYLRDAGVPEDAILTIVDGSDTYQQMTASLAQLQERDLATAMLVSDSYHSHRLSSIADEIGLEAYVSPTAIEPTTDDYLRETAAVSIGQLVGYRRVSAWNSDDSAEG